MEEKVCLLAVPSLLPSPSFLLEMLLIPESASQLLDDSVDDVTVLEGGAASSYDMTKKENVNGNHRLLVLPNYLFCIKCDQLIGG